MTNSFEEFQKRFEMFANKEAADLEAVRTIVQSLLVSMFGAHQNGTALLNDLRSDALATLSRPLTAEAANQDQTKMREATKMAAEEFFEQLRGVFPNMTPRQMTAN